MPAMSRYRIASSPRRILFELSFNNSVFLDCFGRVLEEEYPHSLEGLSSSVEIDSFLESLRGAMVFALDNQAPLRSFPVRRPGAPRLSAILKAQIRERNHLFRRASAPAAVLPWQNTGITGMCL